MSLFRRLIAAGARQVLDLLGETQPPVAPSPLSLEDLARKYAPPAAARDTSGAALGDASPRGTGDVSLGADEVTDERDPAKQRRDLPCADPFAEDPSPEYSTDTSLPAPSDVPSLPPVAPRLCDNGDGREVLSGGLCRPCYDRHRYVRRGRRGPRNVTASASPPRVGSPAPPPVTAPFTPSARPRSLADVPVVEPKREPRATHRKTVTPQLVSQDTADDYAARLRVCPSCVRPGEQVLGKSLQTARTACPRCGKPAADGRIVRGAARRGTTNARGAKLCPCGLGSVERRKQKHRCPEAS